MIRIIVLRYLHFPSSYSILVFCRDDCRATLKCYKHLSLVFCHSQFSIWYGPAPLKIAILFSHPPRFLNGFLPCLRALGPAQVVSVARILLTCLHGPLPLCECWASNLGFCFLFFFLSTEEPQLSVPPCDPGVLCLF